MATVSDLIIAELRAQIDHQVSAADALDTKAAGLAAATFALLTFTVPHVDVSTPWRGAAAAVTVVLTLLALWQFAEALRPRAEGFSYGVDADDLLAARDSVSAAELKRSYADGLSEARKRNQGAVASKADGVVTGLRFLIAVAIGLAIMLAIGGIHG